MKKVTFLLIYLSVFSCKSQAIDIVNSKNKDVIAFFVNQTGEKLKNPKAIYNSRNYFLIQRTRANYNYDRNYHEAYFQFIKDKDTMNIKCYCTQGVNYIFRNLQFKKGTFNVSFDFPKKYNEQTKKYVELKNIISGNQIKNTKEIQKVLFTNFYVSPDEPIQKDIYFKDLEFIEINLKDSINVKLDKIIK